MAGRGHARLTLAVDGDGRRVRVAASRDAVRLIRSRGGQVFVWPIPIREVTGAFALEASTESPGATRAFVRFAGEDFDVFLEADEVGLPDELHFAVKGWRTKRVRAFWNGNSYGSAA